MSEFASTIKESLIVRFPDALYEFDGYQEHNFFLSVGNVHDVIDWLKGEGFNFLTDLTGSHYPDKKGAQFQVVYHIHHLSQNLRLRLKVDLPEDNLEIPTLTDLYAAANWMERETFDFFGIQFTGHPNLTRILNVDDMDYHPMLKAYALEDETRTDKNDTFFGR